MDKKIFVTPLVILISLHLVLSFLPSSISTRPSLDVNSLILSFHPSTRSPYPFKIIPTHFLHIFNSHSILLPSPILLYLPPSLPILSSLSPSPLLQVRTLVGEGCPTGVSGSRRAPYQQLHGPPRAAGGGDRPF